MEMAAMVLHMLSHTPEWDRYNVASSNHLYGLNILEYKVNCP